MGFKRFQAQPVKLGSYWRAELRRARWRKMLREMRTIALLTLLVFSAGMIITNWSNLNAHLPVYYPNCAFARAAGAAPISRGSAGYRSALDADGDGIACEPYRGR
jgi:hypothetical protein